MSWPKPRRSEQVGDSGGAIEASTSRFANATLVPDSWVPQRKWFAGLLGAVVLNLVSGFVDVGAVLEPAISLALDPFGVEATPETIEAAARSAVGWAAGQYLWPEWRSLPATLRRFGRTVLKGVRETLKRER